MLLSEICFIYCVPPYHVQIGEHLLVCGHEEYISGSIDMEVHCSSLDWAKFQSIPSAVLTTSNELLMSTVLPVCDPSKYSIAAGEASPELHLTQVW